tara:strand:+ start:332 stop:592 length:261 start_codon:yes stop_codon:yes gene_type:complete
MRIMRIMTTMQNLWVHRSVLPQNVFLMGRKMEKDEWANVNCAECTNTGAITHYNALLSEWAFCNVKNNLKIKVEEYLRRGQNGHTA